MSGRLGRTVPTPTLTWFPKGAHVTGAVTGDVLLVDHGTFVSRAIRVGQWFIAHTTQRELRGFTWNDHVAFVVDEERVSEMGPSGHEFRTFAEYDDRLCCLVHFDFSQDEWHNAAAVDEACWEAAYGWWQYVSFVVDGVTAAQFDASWGDDIICSTHVSYCLLAAGVFLGIPPERTMPAHWSQAVGARQ